MTSKNQQDRATSDEPETKSLGGLSYDKVREILQQSATLMPNSVELGSRTRLKALEELDVLDKPARRSFEVLVELANKFLGTPVALISLVTDKRQFFLSSNGLHEPWAGCRETPLSHSFCQHVVKRNEPLVVSDATKHSLVKENLAVNEIGVQAYLGVPVVLPDGNVIGSFCAIDSKPRVWTKDDLETIEKLVELTIVELTVQKASRERQELMENRMRKAQKMQAIGQLVGGVAHDFNNVLGGIQIQAELLTVQLDGEAITPVKHIRDSVQSAKGIVQQLLNWSRPAATSRTAVSLNQIVTDSLPLISTYSTKFIDVTFEPSSCEDIILADANQISQILLNLCSNSAYAMKNSGGRIIIEVSNIEIDTEKAERFELEAGKHVVLRVIDNGCGIPEELLPRIHDPYFTTKPVGVGTGLGLWNVYGIAKEHEGQMHVESIVNEGATVEIIFPVSDTKPEVSPIKTPETVADTGGKIRLLVVDDEPIIAEGLASLLNHSGYQAEAFTKYLIEETTKRNWQMPTAKSRMSLES